MGEPEMIRPPAPAGLQPPGKRLWHALTGQFSFEGCEELLVELCTIHDRLCEVRASIKKNGLTIDGKKNQLLDVELKLMAQFRGHWKVLGLADELPEAKRPGRPQRKVH
jgi:hypothetical protein